MSNFEEWLKPQLPYFKPDRDLEVIVEVAFIEKAYEAGRKEILDTIIDMAIVSWTFAEADKDDAKVMIHKLICQAQDQAVDPAISKEAQALIEAGRKAGLEEAAEIADTVDKWCDWESPEPDSEAIATAIRERMK